MEKAKIYFERLNEEIKKKEKALKEFKQLKVNNLIGGTSDEMLDMWRNTEATLRKANSISKGTIEATYCWERFERKESQYIEVKDYLKENDIEDLINHFKNAGIEEFIYSYTGTDAITNLFEFQKAGCTIDKAIEFTVTRYSVTDNSKGILIKVK